mmetsp:Transcript_76396/g.224098  ORF Transcript_76396/g.224098 Transcript_76396/m.224098 type:complete len:363 (-) Transcript_76396:478-1566(-)
MCHPRAAAGPVRTRARELAEHLWPAGGDGREVRRLHYLALRQPGARASRAAGSCAAGAGVRARVLRVPLRLQREEPQLRRGPRAIRRGGRRPQHHASLQGQRPTIPRRLLRVPLPALAARRGEAAGGRWPWGRAGGPPRRDDGRTGGPRQSSQCRGALPGGLPVQLPRVYLQRPDPRGGRQLVRPRRDAGARVRRGLRPRHGLPELPRALGRRARADGGAAAEPAGGPRGPAREPRGAGRRGPRPLLLAEERLRLLRHQAAGGAPQEAGGDGRGRPRGAALLHQGGPGPGLGGLLLCPRPLRGPGAGAGRLGAEGLAGLQRGRQREDGGVRAGRLGAVHPAAAGGDVRGSALGGRAERETGG